MNPARARHWFWALTAVALAAMGGVYRGLHASTAWGAGLLVGACMPVLAASSLQAVRIWLALGGGARAGPEAEHADDSDGGPSATAT